MIAVSTNDTLFVPTEYGVTCLSAEGVLLWNWSSSHHTNGGAAIVSILDGNSLLYVSSNYLARIGVNGTTAWDKIDASIGGWTLPVVSNEGRIFITSHEGYQIQCLDGNGTVIWITNVTDPLGFLPIMSADGILIVLHGITVSGMDMQGQFIWNVTLPNAHIGGDFATFISVLKGGEVAVLRVGSVSQLYAIVNNTAGGDDQISFLALPIVVGIIMVAGLLFFLTIRNRRKTI